MSQNPSDRIIREAYYGDPARLLADLPPIGDHRMFIVSGVLHPLSDPVPAAPPDAETHNMHRSSTNQEPESGRTDAEKRMNTDCS